MGNETNQSPGATRGERLILAGILSLGLALRLVGLGSRPYWQDEIHNLIKAENIWRVLSKGEFVSNHPPLFSVLAAAWRAVGLDSSEGAMRMLPLCLGLCGILAIYWVGKRMLGTRAGLIAAFLLAVSPFHVLHSQDLKVYVLLPFTGTLLAYCLHDAWEGNRRSQWLLYALTVALACYSESFSAFLLVGVNTWALLQLRGRYDRAPGWIVSNLIGVGLFAPYIPVLLRRTDVMLMNPGAWWLPKPTAWTVLFYLKTLAFGYSDLDPLFKVAMTAFFVTAVAGFYWTWSHKRSVGLLLLCWFAIPVALVFVTSRIMGSIFLFRALLPFAIPYYLLVAAGLASVSRRWLRGSLIALFGLFAVLPLHQWYTNQFSPAMLPHRPSIHPPCESDVAARYIVEHWQEGDVVAHAAPPTWATFFWYGLEGYPHYAVGMDADFIRHINEGNPKTSDDPKYDGYFPKPIESVVKGKRRVWYVFSEYERGYLPGNAESLWRWLDLHFVELSHASFHGIELLLYAADGYEDALRTVARECDRGASATMVYEDGGLREYEKHDPDSGLIARPVEERNGRLRLCFSEDEKGDANSPLSFTVRNESDDEVSCNVICMVSDALQEVGALRGSESDAHAWRTQRQYNPEGPPGTYDNTVAAASFGDRLLEEGVVQSTLEGELGGLPSGAYATAVFMLGISGDATMGRAELSIEANQTELLAPISGAGTIPFGWHWWAGRQLALEGPVNLRVTATHNEQCETSYADVGYVIFRRIAGTGPWNPGDALETWPGETTLSAREDRSWVVPLYEGARRVDVWVYEHGPEGSAYRIFRLLQDR